MLGSYSQNDQTLLFTEIYINPLLIRKYVGIYYFLGTWVWGIQVFYGTRVPWTWVLWKNNLQICQKIFYWTQDSNSSNSSTQKMVDFYIFLKQW